MQRQGKELSYNNIADADAAWECVKTFEQPACVIIKHANPCGVAVAASAVEAYRRAFKTDPTSAFGGIIAFNRELDEETAAAVSQQFAEVLIAPRVMAGPWPYCHKRTAGAGGRSRSGCTIRYQASRGGFWFRIPDAMKSMRRPEPGYQQTRPAAADDRCSVAVAQFVSPTQ